MSVHSDTVRVLCSTLLLFLLTACFGADRDQSTIDAETFIATYVDLRAAALRSPDRQISDSERERVMAERGVTEEDLLRFADVHGRDVTFMRDLWDDVEQRLDAMKPTTEEMGRR